MSRRRRTLIGEEHSGIEPWQVREIIEQYRSRARLLEDMAAQPGRSRKELSTLLGDAKELNERADKLEATLDPKPSSRRQRYADDFDDEEVDGRAQPAGNMQSRMRVQSPSRNASRPGFSMPRDPRTGRFVSTRY